MKATVVKITKKEFNAALVGNTTAQIYGRSSTCNRFNDIVASVNDTETMKNVKDNAEWRTVTKTRANGVIFSDGSTLDYAPNNHENNVSYYRVGDVVIMIAAKRNDASDYERNPYIYLIVAYLINVPETNTDNTMKANNTPMNEQTKQYFRNVYGSYQNLCEQVDERLATLRAELQEYNNNHSKGGNEISAPAWGLDMAESMAADRRASSPGDITRIVATGATDYADTLEPMNEPNENKSMYTDYKTAVSWCNNSLVLCNNIVEVDPSVFDNARFAWYDEETERDTEIFQWFITDCSEDDVEYLESHFPGLLFSYSEMLDVFVLCVDHFGTSWDCVCTETTLTNAAKENI